jgi:F-box-like
MHPHSTMLAFLPPEILFYLILDYLPNQDRLSLRATCKVFLHAITPRVFSDVSFRSVSSCVDHDDLFTPYWSHYWKCLQALSNPSCTIAPYVLSLRIKKCNAYFERFPDDEWGTKLEELNSGLGSRSDKYELAEPSVTFLSEQLPLFISRMRNLKTVW